MKISNRLVENVVKRVLLEYGGVSDDIIKLANDIWDEFVNYLKSFPDDWERGVMYGYKGCGDGCNQIKKINLLVYSHLLGYINVNMLLWGYYPEETSFEEALEYLKPRNGIKLYYNQTEKNIIIRLPFPYEGTTIPEEFKDIFISAINHELKHKLQHFKSSRDTITDKNYGLSNTKINITKYNGDDEAKLVIAIKMCYYMFSYVEIDARLQEIYVQYSRVGDFNKCRAYQMIMQYKKEYEEILDKINNPEFMDKFSSTLNNIFDGGLSVNGFLKHCQNGIDRFNEHFRRIVGRIYNEQS